MLLKHRNLVEGKVEFDPLLIEQRKWILAGRADQTFEGSQFLSFQKIVSTRPHVAVEVRSRVVEQGRFVDRQPAVLQKCHDAPGHCAQLARIERVALLGLGFGAGFLNLPY